MNGIWKKIASLGLVASMAFSFAACGGPASSAAPSGAASGSTQEPKEMPTVVMTYALMNVPKDQAMVAEKLAELAKEKAGVNLVLEPIAFASYAQQMNLEIAGTRQIDIAMVMGMNLQAYQAKEALVPLDELLNSEAGKSITSALGDYIKGGIINGQVYQLPAIRNMAGQYGVVLRKDLVEKYNIDLSSIKTEKDLEPIFETVSAGEPGMSMVCPEATGADNYYLDMTFDDLSDTFGVLMNYGKELKVENLYETDYYRGQCELHREWYKKGWIPSDILTKADSTADLIRAGKLFAMECVLKPGSAQEKTNQSGYEMVQVPYTTPFAYTSKVNGFGWSILQNSVNPEAAVKVLNLLYTDPDFINLIDWGIEGVHYQKVDGQDNVITFANGLDNTTSGYYHNWGYEFGNQLLSYVWQGNAPDLWVQMEAFNSSAIISKAMGFQYNQESVKNEYTAVKNVASKYILGLSCGALDIDENLPKFQADLKAAGIDAIIAEKQAQLDAWAQANGVK